MINRIDRSQSNRVKRVRLVRIEKPKQSTISKKIKIIRTKKLKGGRIKMTTTAMPISSKIILDEDKIAQFLNDSKKNRAIDNILERAKKIEKNIIRRD